MVNFADLLALAQHYGQAGGRVNGDFNDDGIMNFADVLMLAQSYGQSESSSAVAALPEPVSMLPIALLAMALSRRRR